MPSRLVFLSLTELEYLLYKQPVKAASEQTTLGRWRVPI